MACPKPSPRFDAPQRLQKYLASCGIGSRRACERLIAEGRVSVDGRTVVRQGVVVDPRVNAVAVDSRRVTPGRIVTLLFNKPRNVMCTASDPAGRRTVFSFLPRLPARVFTVGRLDYASEGLLIVTSDGALAQTISHPSNCVEKTYLVEISRALSGPELEKLRRGVWDEGEWLRASSVRPASGTPGARVYEIVIGEGRNRHIRRMLASLGVKVLSLRRAAVGPIQLGNLKPGQSRPIEQSELDSLARYIAARSGGS